MGRHTSKGEAMRKAMIFLLGTLLAALLVTPAMASGGGTVIRKAGVCSGTSTAAFKVKKDDGLIVTEFELDSNVVGQTWRFAFKDNGVKFFGGLRTTQAPSGSFTVRKAIPDPAGSDRITASATNLSTGEVCRASA